LKDKAIPDEGGVFEYFAYSMEKHASADAEQGDLTEYKAISTVYVSQ
jgi:hypothetical protein